MDATFAYAGGLDMQVKMYDLQARKEMLVGKHLAGVSCIEVSSTTGLIERAESSKYRSDE